MVVPGILLLRRGMDEEKALYTAAKVENRKKKGKKHEENGKNNTCVYINRRRFVDSEGHTVYDGGYSPADKYIWITYGKTDKDERIKFMLSYHDNSGL